MEDERGPDYASKLLDMFEGAFQTFITTSLISLQTKCGGFGRCAWRISS